MNPWGPERFPCPPNPFPPQPPPWQQSFNGCDFGMPPYDLPMCGIPPLPPRFPAGPCHNGLPWPRMACPDFHEPPIGMNGFLPPRGPPLNMGPLPPPIGMCPPVNGCPPPRCPMDGPPNCLMNGPPPMCSMNGPPPGCMMNGPPICPVNGLPPRCLMDGPPRGPFVNPPCREPSPTSCLSLQGPPSSSGPLPRSPSQNGTIVNGPPANGPVTECAQPDGTSSHSATRDPQRNDDSTCPQTKSSKSPVEDNVPIMGPLLKDKAVPSFKPFAIKPPKSSQSVTKERSPSRRDQKVSRSERKRRDSLSSPKKAHRRSPERRHKDKSPKHNHRHSSKERKREEKHRHDKDDERRSRVRKRRQSSTERRHSKHSSRDRKSPLRSRRRCDSRDRKRTHSRGHSRLSPIKRPRLEERNHKISRHANQTAKCISSISKRCIKSTSRRSDKPDGTIKTPSTPLRNIICFSSFDHLYYEQSGTNPCQVSGTEKLIELLNSFQFELNDRAARIKAVKPKYEPPQRKVKLRKPKPPKTEESTSSSSSEDSSSDEEDTAMEELEKKKKHPDRLHAELWFNDPGEMNDGPLCRCSAKARRSGIRHGIYAGEDDLALCDPNSNNADKLYHYRITMSPNTNFLSKCPTTIKYKNNNYYFEGFSMFSHSPIPDLPYCKVIRFNIEYTILYVKESFPTNFTVRGLELFTKYLMIEVLELVDLYWNAHGDNTGCPRFHFLPRFVRDVEGGSKELLSMNAVLGYLLECNKLLIEAKDLEHLMGLRQHKWQDFADKVKGMIVTCPGMKPSSIRVDQLDREQCNPDKNIFPEIIHFGVRPPQLSYAGNPDYQKAWRDYVKFRHLLANKPKVVYADRHQLLQKERRLQEMRMKNNLKRDVTVVINSQNFYKTGIMCDVVQHAMLLPVLVCHLRFHQSLDVLEVKTGYKFADRYLLQLALTHPSYRENFGTNPDHARNSLTNCGIRQPEYGDRRIHYMNTRKRGINTLINIMSRFGRREETASRINHNERLEFLGDAVVEFLSSIHLFYMFPSLEEGGLATYRAAIVQNQHLAVLAKKLQLEKFMLYAHGSDLCHDLELRHAMANCFEALMGALFLDSGIDTADRVFSETLFLEPDLLDVWVNYPPHPLQEQEPGGDRKWLTSVPLLQKLHEFEDAISIEFTHIRLLARALTHRSLGFNNLTLGSNQRLEFLGDTVLQLVASEYLYKFFPEHHEGHLSLLRSSLVNNRTQAVVCDDLGMVDYAIYPHSKVELKAKDRADLLEAFLGALYVDKDLGYCTKFCEVCFFPRLQDFIMNQEWNDPKSKLQQCCLTLRTMDGGEPDIPVYKVIECKGPTNTRVYAVAVYFRRKRLAVGSGHSIQQAEMAAAENALKASRELFPQLDHQRRAIEKSLKQRTPSCRSKGSSSKHKKRR